MPSLSDILGQNAAVDVLCRAIENQKVAQAYLFSGPEGVGKATTARALAGALNCLEAPGKGCHRCLPCSKLEEGNHPDFLVLAPDGVYIKIQQVRALESHLGYAPHEGRFRVVLVDGADKLNEHAANALLKSVEEPRPRTLFVLATGALHRVVPTLVSRCQRIRFAPLDRESLLEIVQRASEADARQQEAAVALAEGSAQKALRLLEESGMAALRQTMSALLQCVWRQDTAGLFQTVSDAGKDRATLAEMLDLMRIWLRDLLLVAEGLDQGRVVNTDQYEQLKRTATTVRYPAVLKYLRAVDEAQTALQGNVQPALLLEHLVLSMRQVTLQ